MLKIIECPRDAMQGIKDFIPTELKIRYINQLLKVGFDVIDFGSFVSAKAIPQMQDTATVLAGLELEESRSKLLAIVANERGANDAAAHEQITYLGYPFSISETFQQRNTNATIAQSLERVKAIQEICVRQQKQLVIYISMAFGNPYNDPWNAEIAGEWVDKLYREGIRTFALADTVGVAEARDISSMFSTLIPEFEAAIFGAHLHTTPTNWKEKVEAAYNAGCRRFDTAIKGFGGCPMAKDDLVGNLATENLLAFLSEKDESHPVQLKAFHRAEGMAMEVFG